MMRIIPIITAPTAFSLGPPGKLITFVKIGLKKARIPSMVTRTPAITNTVFTVIILSTLI